jgi:hypothetical protein
VARSSRPAATENLAGRQNGVARVDCDATVDGKPLTIGHGIDMVGELSTKAKAECRWDVPHDGAGKVFRGSVKLRFKGKPLTRSFAARITR